MLLLWWLWVFSERSLTGPALLQGAGVEKLASSALERADSNILELLQQNGLHLSPAVAVSRDWGLIKHLQAAAVLC